VNILGVYAGITIVPRANRFYLPNCVWHLTHRCHDRKFLLRFECDRLRWKYWLYRARKRYGLVVLNYMATANHVHLLVKDTEPGVIARAMQLIAGRTAQEYNRRKARKGAFWEDRYFATAVATDQHLVRCLTYIDLNMVRACAVVHPAHWRVCGFNEIQSPPQRHRIIDGPALCDLAGFTDISSFQAAHLRWVGEALRIGGLKREPQWTESVAIGPPDYVQRIKSDLGVMARYRTVVTDSENTCVIKEVASA
jgi:putative transposase